MSAERTIAALLETARTDHREDRLTRARQNARVAWVSQTIARIKAAHEAVNAAWDRRLDEHAHLSDDELEAIDFPELPEEAELAAMLAEVKAVCDHGRWPKALHWGGV